MVAGGAGGFAYSHPRLPAAAKEEDVSVFQEWQDQVDEWLRQADSSGQAHWARQRESARLRGEQPIRNADDAIAQHIALAHVMARSMEGDNGISFTGGEEGYDDDEFLLSVYAHTVTMIDAVPYVWADHIYDAVAGAAVPRHTVDLSSYPKSEMWWAWETPKEIKPGLRSLGYLVSIDPKGEMVHLQDICIPDAGLFPQPFLFRDLGSVLKGAVWPDDWAESDGSVSDQSASERDAYADFVRFMTFLEAPFVRTREMQVTRAARRSRTFQSNGTSTAPPPARFVYLRRAQSPSAQPSGESGSPGRNFRWVVRGHIRNQWYAKTKTHKLRWVTQYLKGPEDRPLRPRTYRVTR